MTTTTTVVPVTSLRFGQEVFLSSDQTSVMNFLSLVSRSITTSLPTACDGRAPGVELSVEVSENANRLVVRDSGGGIAEADQNRLFEPFFTTRTEASGLGLAVVRAVVEDAGGAVLLETSGPDGSSFAISLPGS